MASVCSRASRTLRASTCTRGEGGEGGRREEEKGGGGGGEKMKIR